MKIEIKNGIVLNDGDEIGQIRGNVCHLIQTIGPVIKGSIKKVSGIDLSFTLDEPEPSKVVTLEPEPPSESVSSLPDESLIAEMRRRGFIHEAPPPPSFVPSEIAAQVSDIPARDMSGIERLNALAKAGKIPAAPEKHPAMGDKTPAYVEWFKTCATAAEIEARYPSTRLLPASVSVYEAAQKKLEGRLPGEKKDTNPENDFNGKEEEQ
jgi:hypothetical protein